MKYLERKKMIVEEKNTFCEGYLSVAQIFTSICLLTNRINSKCDVYVCFIQKGR